MEGTLVVGTGCRRTDGGVHAAVILRVELVVQLAELLIDGGDC